MLTLCAGGATGFALAVGLLVIAASRLGDRINNAADEHAEFLGVGSSFHGGAK